MTLFYLCLLHHEQILLSCQKQSWYHLSTLYTRPFPNQCSWRYDSDQIYFFMEHDYNLLYWWYYENYIIFSSNKLKVNKNIQIAPIVQLYVRVYSKQLNVYLSRTFLYKSSLLLKALDAKHTLAIQARWYMVESVQITD